MKTYQVEITETLKKTVEIEADNPDEAEEIASQHWKNSEFILDAECFDGVEFKTVGKQRSHDFER